jgi:putative phosphoesterase
MDILRRIGIIGDVHAEDSLLGLSLHFLQSQDVDALICTGDIADGPHDVNRCCELLQHFNVAVVRGNHDRWILANEMRHLPDTTSPAELSESTRAYLENLPLVLNFQTVAGQLQLCHGLARNDMARLTPDDYGYALEMNKELQLLLSSAFRFVVGGHTHRRMVRPIGKVTFINAGTLFHKHSPGFAVADLEKAEVQFFDLIDGEVTAAQRLTIEARSRDRMP